MVQAQASLAAVLAANRDQALQAAQEARLALQELLGPTRDVRERQPRRCTRQCRPAVGPQACQVRLVDVPLFSNL